MSFMELMGEALKFHKTGRFLSVTSTKHYISSKLYGQGHNGFSVLGKDGEVMSFMELMGEALKFHKTGRFLSVSSTKSII